MRLTLPLTLPLALLACSDISLVAPKGDDCDPLIWYEDVDGDGYGAGEPVASCEAPEGFIEQGGDCDDSDALVSPAGSEACNGIDDDCDGLIDQGIGDLETWYVDADGDGFGDEMVEACEQPPGTVVDGGDCDDGDAAVNPDAIEICNGADDDCDGSIDQDAADAETWYYDGDGDGYGVSDPVVQACEEPSGYTDNADDCDDSDDTLDLDCSGTDGTDPLDVTPACSGTVYRFSGTPGEPELIVLSLYEADGGHGGPPGTVTVDVQRATEMTLVVSSYEPVDWEISAVAGATINEVLANGYHAQTVTAPSGVPTSVRSYDQTRSDFGAACGYSWPYAGGGCDTNLLIAGVERHTGLRTTEFTGCYHGTSFVVR